MQDWSFVKETKVKKTYIGDIPDDWKLIKLGEIGSIGVGKQRRIKRYVEGKYLLISPKKISDEKYILQTKITLPEDEALRCSPILRKNTIVIVSTGHSIGKIGMVKKPSVVNQHVSYLICNNNANPDYIYYYLKAKTNIIKQFSETSTIPYLRRSSLRNMMIPMPSIDEQKDISRLIESMNTQIKLKTLELELLNRMSAKIQGSLLDGEVRIRNFPNG